MKKIQKIIKKPTKSKKNPWEQDKPTKWEPVNVYNREDGSFLDFRTYLLMNIDEFNDSLEWALYRKSFINFEYNMDGSFRIVETTWIKNINIIISSFDLAIKESDGEDSVLNYIIYTKLPNSKQWNFETRTRPHILKNALFRIYLDHFPEINLAVGRYIYNFPEFEHNQRSDQFRYDEYLRNRKKNPRKNQGKRK